MIKTITCAAVVSGMTASAAYAASFDCNHAPLSNTEHIICDDVRISKKDDQLHKEYTALLAALPANDKAAFKQEQHQWITTRDRCTGGYEYTVGCLHEAYDQRLYEFGLRSKKLEVQAEVEAETRAAAVMNTVDVQPAPIHEMPKPAAPVTQLQAPVPLAVSPIAPPSDDVSIKLPKCDSENAESMVKDAFQNSPVNKIVNWEVLALKQIKTLSADPDKVTCSAQALTNGGVQLIQYDFEWLKKEDETYFVQIKMIE